MDPKDYLDMLETLSDQLDDVEENDDQFEPGERDKELEELNSLIEEMYDELNEAMNYVKDAERAVDDAHNSFIALSGMIEDIVTEAAEDFLDPKAMKVMKSKEYKKVVKWYGMKEDASRAALKR